MPTLHLSFASGESSLSVRRFSVEEAVSRLFTIAVVARSESPAIELESIVGRPAGLRIATGYKFAHQGGQRIWTGVCSAIEQTQAEPTGLSTYELRVVPTLWLLTQRRGYRIFQHLTIPDIGERLLAEWGIEAAWAIDRARYPRLEYKVQYGETDYAFLSRLLEEAGIAFTFQEDEQKGSLLTFSDALHRGAPRAETPLVWVDNPNQASEMEFVTRVRIAHEVRPGAYTLRDYDFRNPSFPLFAEATRAKAPEDRHEQYHYRPGSFLVEGGRGGETPVADDKGVARYDQRAAVARADRSLEAERLGKRAVSFATNAIDLRPGTVFSIDQHPNPELGAASRLLALEFTVEGSPDQEWTMSGRAVFADVAYRPPMGTPKPVVSGVQSAMVVGRKGLEIDPDEFGRVRVQFPWDREGRQDDTSSCWIRVSQGWAGTGFGGMLIPRIGQEVLVGFLEGDPDQPIVVGRVFNNTERVPYKLPENKTRSTWKSDSSPGSNGFNEIMFEDFAGKELVFEQAQKNRRRLVKNDETITVGNDRQKLVKANETETTLLNWTEVTGVDRTEITGAHRVIAIGGDRDQLVKGNEQEQTVGSLKRSVGGSADVTVGGALRERVGSHHVTVGGDELARVGGSSSLTVAGSRHDKVGADLGLEVGGHIHVKAGASLVLEVGSDFTIKGPGGFIRINAEGLTMKGSVVKINSGGSPGKGNGVNPVLPAAAEPAEVVEPAKPEMDDVGRTGIGQ